MRTHNLVIAAFAIRRSRYAIEQQRNCWTDNSSSRAGNH